MEKLITIKNDSIRKMNMKKFKYAIRGFDQVIDAIPNPSKDDEAILKGTCLLNRSSCKLMEDNFSGALEDADAVIKLYKSLRSEEAQLNTPPEKLSQDPLTNLLSLAYVKRGEAFEAQLDFHNAFHEYAAGSLLCPDGDAQKSMKALLKNLNVPDINPKDEDLLVFKKLVLNFINEPELISTLSEALEFVSKEMKPELVSKINQTKCSNIFCTIAQLYIENEFIVDTCVTALRMLADKNISSVYNGFLILKEIMLRWSKNVGICSECIKILVKSPEDMYKYFVKEDFVTPIANCFQLKLENEIVEDLFLLLYNISSSPSQLNYVVESGVINYIQSCHSIGALMVLSKISMNRQIIIETYNQGGIEWILNLVKENPEKLEVIIAASIFISRTLLNKDVNIKKEELDQMFDVFVPITIKNSKNMEVVSSTFASYALAAEFCQQKIIETKLLRTASAILAIHLKRTNIAQNIVTFFYECATHGLLNEMLEIRSIVPTIMSALSENPQYQPIVERAVAIAVLSNHPNKIQLFEAAQQQFPRSETLSKFVDQYKK